MTQEEIVERLVLLKKKVIKTIEDTPGRQDYNLKLAHYLTDAAIATAKGETVE